MPSACRHLVFFLSTTSATCVVPAHRIETTGLYNLSFSNERITLKTPSELKVKFEINDWPATDVFLFTIENIPATERTPASNQSGFRTRVPSTAFLLPSPSRSTSFKAAQGLFLAVKPTRERLVSPGYLLTTPLNLLLFLCGIAEAPNFLNIRLVRQQC